MPESIPSLGGGHGSTRDLRSTSSSTRKMTSDPSLAAATSATRMDDVQVPHTREEIMELEYRRKIVPKLARRAYHLEENGGWWDDWIQYQRNTHPLFGLCLYHRLHPIRWQQRIIILIGSIACGFAITNCIYLGFLEEGAEEMGLESAYNATGTIIDVISDAQRRYTNVEIKRSLFYLLTVGSAVHSLFDMLIWYLMACFCFRPGGGFKINKRCQTVGIYVAVSAVLLAIGAATYFVLVRLNKDIENQADYEATDSEEFADRIIGDDEPISKFAFFLGYALELVVALFLFYFITSTVFFSGILGCGRVPILGGRPYEMWRERMAKDGDRKPDDVER